MVRRLCVACVVLLICAGRQGTAAEKFFSLVFRGNLTTGSQLFPMPNASDPFDRAQYLPINDILGVGIELRYRIPETNLAFGISAEYLRTTTDNNTVSFYGGPNSPIKVVGNSRIPVEDGYRVIPLEATGYFLIPISGPTFGVYMGGGAGAYFGHRIFRIAGTEAGATNSGVGFGIHVLGGMSFTFTDFFALSAEMKFRDLQFESTNAFSRATIHYGDSDVSVSTEPFDSRVHTDGIVFQLGAILSF